MTTHTTPAERAQELLQLPTLPTDARERMDALAKEAEGTPEAFMFDMLYEGLFLAEQPAEALE